MKRHGLAVLLAFPFLISLGAAQQSKSAESLTDVQKTGKRIFEQRCPICHTERTGAMGTYGPFLYKEIIDGNERAIHLFIENGSRGRMPGFRFTLQSSDIEAIIAYLKTVPKPPASNLGKDANEVD
jgi:mono/diheme cytochrome c family protein